MPFACSSLVHFDVILNIWFAAARKSCSNALGKRAGPLGLKYGSQIQRLSVGSAGFAHHFQERAPLVFAQIENNHIWHFDSTVGMFNGGSGSWEFKNSKFHTSCLSSPIGFGHLAART